METVKYTILNTYKVLQSTIVMMESHVSMGQAQKVPVALKLQQKKKKFLFTNLFNNQNNDYRPTYV